MKKIIRNIFAMAFLVCGFSSIAQTISKVESVVSGNNIEVQYSVSGLKFNQTVTTSLYVSIDGGFTFQGPLLEVNGDIGEKIYNGRHMVIWEAMKEIPLENVNTIFDVRAIVVNEKIKKSFFTALSGNQVTPFGLRIGMIGGLGFYLMGQSNTTPALTGSYTYENGTITDYDRFAWYEFTSKHKIASFMLCGGVTSQVARKLYLYGGLGYGREDCLYEINEYSYDGDTPLGMDYARDSKISASGIAVEVGAMLKTGKILFTGGASSIGFKILNWQAGIGLAF